MRQLRGHGHRHVEALGEPAELAPLVHRIAAANDMVICLGAGSITAWANALPGELSALRPGAKEACG